MSSKSLLELLENSTQSLESRLKIALSSFTVTDSHAVKNKLIVLKWLQMILEQVTEEALIAQVYSVLKCCITNITDVWLHPQLADAVISILHASHPGKAVSECCIEVLGNAHFVRYFVHNLKVMSDIIAFLANQLSSDMDCQLVSDICDTVTECILDVKNHAICKSDLKLVFVNSLMDSLLILYREHRRLDLEQQTVDTQMFENCCYQILFADPEFRNIFVKNLLSEGTTDSAEHESHANSVIKTVKEYPAKYSFAELAFAYSLLLSGFLVCNTSVNEKFKVFVGLNSFIRVCPVQLNDPVLKGVTLNNYNRHTVCTLIEVLLKFDLSLEATCNSSFTLMDWLRELLEIILNGIQNGLDTTTLQLLKNVYGYSPHLLEDTLRKFTKNVMLLRKENPEIVSAYSDLCMRVLNVHIKSNRMQKLISAVLTATNESLTDINEENVPDKFEILPEQIFAKIQRAVTNLPSTVPNIALLNTLLYHLEKSCIVKLEGDKSKKADIRVVLQFDIVTSLISQFISGTRIVDHSVPEAVKEKYRQLMGFLATYLEKFGKAVVAKEHVSKLMESFLNLCLVWGNMEIAFMKYESTPRKIPKQVGNLGKPATNLVYIHSYLTDYHWKLIAQRVMNFGDGNCVKLLNDLVLQKIHALPYLEDEFYGPYTEALDGNGPGVVCANYLSSNADAKWLFQHISEFAHLLKPEDILRLSQTLINYCQHCDDEEVDKLLSDDFREIRSLVLASLCCTFWNIKKKFLKINMKELKRVLRKLDYEQLVELEVADDGYIEYDKDKTTQNVKDMISEIGTILSKDLCVVGEVEEFTINRDIYILVRLPVPYLEEENMTLMWLLSLSVLKNLIMVQSKIESVDKECADVVNFLQGMRSTVNVPATLNTGKLITWFYRNVKNFDLRDSIVKLLCYVTDMSHSEVHNLMENINSNPMEAESASQQLVTDFQNVDLAATCLINFDNIRKRKQSADVDEDVEMQLMKLCHENFEQANEYFSKDPKYLDKLLELYTLLLKDALKRKDAENLELLLGYLQQFVDYITNVENLESPENVSKFLKVILLHKRILEPRLPERFLFNTWCVTCYFIDKPVLRLFLKELAVPEYEEILRILCADTEGSLSILDNENFETLYRLWKIIINTPVKENKSMVRKNVLTELCNLTRRYIVTESSQNVPCTDTGYTVRTLLKIFTALIQNRDITLQYQMIDVSFDLVSFGSLCRYTPLLEATELLFSICKIRMSSVLDRIPSFYSCYKSLCVSVASNSKTTFSCDEEIIISSAHKLEKLTDVLYNCRKEFTKTAISAIADFMSLFTEVKVEENAKNHLKNAVYRWIGYCDSHGHQYLQSTLSPASQILFKEFWSNYNKYHKFKGKV